MKQFLFVVAQDLRRTMISWTFLFAVLGLAFVNIVTLFDEYQYTSSSTSILYLEMLMEYRDFYIVFLLFAALPGTTLFCSDWDNRYIRFSVMRSTKNKYAVSKVLTCFFSAVLTVVLGNWLTVALLSLRYPLYLPGDEMNAYGAYQAFINEKWAWLYLMVSFLCKGFCAGFLSVMALWFSTIVTNVFVTLATPMLAYYLIQVVQYAIAIVPFHFMIGNLTNARIQLGSPGSSFLYTLGLFLVLTVLFGFGFVQSCKRRIRNG